jgi:hypothetical protein
LDAKIYTVKEYFTSVARKEAVLIVDEFDYLVGNYSYYITDKEVRGLWELKGKHVIGLSGTISPNIERFI